MPGKQENLATIVDSGVIAIVRLDHPAQLLPVATAIANGGVRAIEFAMTSPGALEALREATAALGADVLIGAGTVLDAETARACILAGARFLVAPVVRLDMIEMCRRYGVLCVPGAFTPSEILRAWEAGADLVKVFPAAALGPSYVRDVQAPLPQVPLVPVGGVNLSNAAEFLRAGAAAIGVSSALADRRLVDAQRYEELTQRATEFRDVVTRARAATEASVLSQEEGTVTTR